MKAGFISICKAVRLSCSPIRNQAIITNIMTDIKAGSSNKAMADNNNSSNYNRATRGLNNSSSNKAMMTRSRRL